MKYLPKSEEMAMFLTTMFYFSQLHFSWWWYPLLTFTPDFSMVAYLGGPRVGALVYNTVHHKALGLGVWIYGTVRSLETWQLAGLILFGHSCLDRLLGYGLKYNLGFAFTHLGTIGKTNNQPVSH
jgi:hypothetical protein